MIPYAHQEEACVRAVSGLLSDRGFGLFMDVGTGKSKTLLMVAERMRGYGVDTLVIVAPKTLAGTWKDQLAVHCGMDDAVAAFYSGAAAKTKRWAATLDQMMAARFRVFFVNVEAFRAPNRELSMTLKRLRESSSMLLCAVDESSEIKGPTAAQAKNLTAWARVNADYRMIMTGTPVTHSILDLYQQFEFLRESCLRFRSFYAYKNYYAVLRERHISGGRTFKEVVGFRRTQELFDDVSRHVYSIRKEDCLDLPEQVHVKVPLPMDGEVRRVYEEMKKNLMARLRSGEVVNVVNKIAMFAKFRQVVGGTLVDGEVDGRPAKLEFLLADAGEHASPAVVFACFRAEIDLITAALAAAGHTVCRFDGETSEAEREAAVSDFAAGRVRFIVANPMAASQGLNLQAASLMYWYSLPAQEKHYEQGLGRIHRAGQRNSCVYKYLLVEGSVDVRMLELLSGKMDVASRFRDGTLDDVIAAL